MHWFHSEIAHSSSFQFSHVCVVVHSSVPELVGSDQGSVATAGPNSWHQRRWGDVQGWRKTMEDTGWSHPPFSRWWQREVAKKMGDASMSGGGSGAKESTLKWPICGMGNVDANKLWGDGDLEGDQPRDLCEMWTTHYINKGNKKNCVSSNIYWMDEALDQFTEAIGKKKWL